VGVLSFVFSWCSDKTVCVGGGVGTLRLDGFGDRIARQVGLDTSEGGEDTAGAGTFQGTSQAGGGQVVDLRGGLLLARMAAAGSGQQRVPRGVCT